MVDTTDDNFGAGTLGDFLSKPSVATAIEGWAKGSSTFEHVVGAIVNAMNSEPFLAGRYASFLALSEAEQVVRVRRLFSHAAVLA